jgi:hypothetical protein
VIGSAFDILGGQGSAPNDESQRSLLDFALAPCRAVASASPNALPCRSRRHETNAQRRVSERQPNAWRTFAGRSM